MKRKKERPQCNQIAWEQGYECGYSQAKVDIIRRIAEQYSEHNELIPKWLSIGDIADELATITQEEIYNEEKRKACY